MRARPTHRLIGIVAAAALSTGLLAGCGGGSSGGDASKTPAFNEADAQAQAKANWQKFFDPKETTDTRVALIQGGEDLRQAIVLTAKNPLASKATTTVTKVAVDPADHNKATVTYNISVNGSNVVEGGTGEAVYENGTWKVSTESFCGLATAGAGAGVKVPGCEV